MMDCFGETEDDQFFDTHEEIASYSDFGSDSLDDCSTSGSGSPRESNGCMEDWDLESVDTRRDRFLRRIGLSSDWHVNGGEDPGDSFGEEINKGCSEPLLINSHFEDNFLFKQSLPFFRSNEAPALAQNKDAKDFGTDSCVDKLAQNESIEMGSDRVTTADDFAFSPLVLQASQEQSVTSSLLERRRNSKKGWLQKLNVVSRFADRHEESLMLGSNNVHVHSHRKKSKELSSLFAEQEFPAHKGAILIMKFSPDGQLLATAGEDGVVRVWRVIEDDKPREFDVQGNDPSSLYFSMNQLSKLTLLNVEKEKTRSKITKLKKSSESACVIFPPEVFRILEKPVHEYHGHGGKVLALSWSKKGCLLSSSVDKTVRMWQVGNDECLKVFSHNNYVIAVEFNPVDDNCLISGSIDGKVRIWEVHTSRVIDWIDTRDIITAVCYRPDGKGAIVGTLDGSCRFYDIRDGRLQLDAHINLNGKKKLPGKRITGFQFCPIDPSKVMVTSADSQVRILRGIDIQYKFKGSRSSGSQVSASFTSDGRHIISAAEDSNVFVWNNINSDRTYPKEKCISSSESFLSQNATIAIPWCGMRVAAIGNGKFPNATPLSTPDCFSSLGLGRGFFLDSLCKGSPTWPAEMLPEPNPGAEIVSPAMRKSEFKLLKSAYQRAFLSPHLWGLVIVTGGWDGRIRTYLNYGLPVRL